MGAAGLTSSSVEMAGKGGLGIELDLDRVPVRETGMTAYEIMLSESQERMLMVLRPGSEAEARRIFEKWELDFAVIGRVTETGRLVLRMRRRDRRRHPGRAAGHRSAALRAPVAAPRSRTGNRPGRPSRPRPARMPEAADRLAGARLEALDLGAVRPSRDGQHGQAARRRRRGGPRFGEGKALALATDCTPRYCRADPVRGGAQAVAESWRNLTAVGAAPLALTDNMNFGNPERPEIMGQFVGAIEGMREACLALDYPVVSGNVSLYNETSGSAILPTPVIGGVGLIADARNAVDLALKRDGDALILIGETRGHLGASLYLREIEGREAGPPPPVDLAAERRNGDFVRAMIAAAVSPPATICRDGGLLVAIAEMAMAGVRGVALDRSRPNCRCIACLFGEDQARYLIETADPQAVLGCGARCGGAGPRHRHGRRGRVDTPRRRCHIG